MRIGNRCSFRRSASRIGRGVLRAAIGGACVLQLVLAASVSAQRVIGIVRDSASGEPIAGAVVTLLDSAGRLASRSVSGSSGRFSAPVVGAVRRVSLIRIGFRPMAIPLTIAYPHADTTVALTMVALPTLLASMHVVDQPACKRRDDRSTALALWEQARSALLATVVARNATPAAVTSIRFDQHRASYGDRIISQLVTHDSTDSNRPWVAARAASEFGRTGYVANDNGVSVFFAPDADGLLDPAFAATHCFSLDRDARHHAGELGLSFEPMQAHTGISDIAGTIWIDSTARELRTLGFRFTNLDPAAVAEGAGGSLSFRTANGVAMIDRWNIHIPQFERTKLRSQRDPDNIRTTLTGVHDIGGEITSASWPDGTSWRTPTGEVHGQVSGFSDGKPIARALVWLPGTDDSTRTSADGSFVLPRVLPGPYVVFAADSMVARGEIPENAPLRVDVDTLPANGLSIRLPDAVGFTHQSCDSLGVHQRASSNAASVFVVGRIALSDGTPAVNAGFDARWLGNAMRDGVRQSGTTDSTGTFHLCYVSPAVPVVISTWLDSLRLERKDTLTFVDAPVAPARLTLSPRRPITP